ncbi:FAD-dependent oxidoreductase [Paenibacillus thalictri]|uniref:FAD-dependent oxidoreductase n=1 Tax=Paenibacillus thalictri TaxID=2527873 RepID=A0A4Q9DNT2_9BACL|nr:FAD-dependent oxidoreductase [Paenibacillus thalictri]TBL74561.1 FAD-dependent oxidoreductase [Paenibacillus thalictri]
MNHMSEKADVVIVGGTPSGIACAVRCAREGLRVVLVSFMNQLGGVMSSGLGVTDNVYDGFRAPVYNLFVSNVREYYRTAYGDGSQQYEQCYVNGKLHVEPHVAQRVFTELVHAEEGISVLYRYFPVSVERSGAMLSAVTLQSFEGAETIRIEAGAFVDASYEGDLAALAGTEMRTGREGRNEYAEPHAGKLFVFPGSGPISEEAVAGLTVVPSDDGQRIYVDPTGEGDDAFQAYNFRVCLTCDPENRVYPARPDTYDRTLYLGLAQKPEENSKDTFVLRSHLMLGGGHWSLKSHIPNDKLTWNDPLLLGANLEYPAAGWRRREEIVREHEEFALGMLYFLQNDLVVSREVRQEALRWGLPKDEFADNGHFPYEILVREGRRMAGRYVFTEHDGLPAPGLERTPVHADSAGIADWPISSHDCTADRRPGSLNDGTLNLSGISRTAQIPYRSMLPQHLDNLLVTICLSCSHIGWGTLRLEPVFMQLGESAALAVSLARESGTPPGKLDADSVVRKLAENRVMISYFADIDGLMPQERLIALQYFGTKGFFDSYTSGWDEPLDAHTAEVWIKAFGDLLAGVSNPLEIARKLGDKQRGTQPLSGSAWFGLLEQELAARGCDAALRPSDLKERTMVTRGDTCCLLYRILTPTTG